jgi:proteasome accessory factor B
MSVSRIYRLLRLVTMLQSGRSFTAGELADEMEVSRRTVFRDLNMLEMAHIPYYFDAVSGGYKINQHFFLPPVNLTLPEALSMLILTASLRQARQLPLLAHSAKAAMKLESALPAAVREHIGSVIDNLSVSLGPVSRHEGLDATFDDLTRAIIERRICRLVYISFAERRQIVTSVRPLRLTFASRAWYLLAWSCEHREVRTFKLGRIRKLTVTDRRFTPPKDLNLEEHFGDAWSMIPEGRMHQVHLHFEPKVAGNVAEVLWHRRQRLEWQDDGSLDYFVTVDGLGEITWWILGYGDQVEVVGPPELRQHLRQIAGEVLRKHRSEVRSP